MWGGSPLYLLYGEVPLDRVWFSGIPVSNRVYNSSVCVLNRVFIPLTSSRVLSSRVAWARAHQNIKHVLEHGIMFKALYWHFRSSLEQGPKSKWIFLNRVSYFPDYSLKQGQGFTVPAVHPYSITQRVPSVEGTSVITGPKCNKSPKCKQHNNKTKCYYLGRLLHLGPNVITFRTFTTLKTKYYYTWDFYYI